MPFSSIFILRIRKFVKGMNTQSHLLEICIHFFPFPGVFGAIKTFYGLPDVGEIFGLVMNPIQLMAINRLGHGIQANMEAIQSAL